MLADFYKRTSQRLPSIAFNELLQKLAQYNTTIYYSPVFEMKSAETLLLMVMTAAIFAVNSVNGGWQDDIDKESAGKGSYTHSQLAAYLRDYLDDKYSSDSWVVIVYADVSGGKKHTFKGYTSTVHAVFRQSGHNIVVGRLAGGNSVAAPTNIKAAFLSAITPAPLQCTSPFWGDTYCYVNSEKTNFDTWDELVSQGQVTPLMLHIASNYEPDYVNLKRAVSSGLVTQGYLYAAVGTKYYVTLLAKA